MCKDPNRTEYFNITQQHCSNSQTKHCLPYTDPQFTKSLIPPLREIDNESAELLGQLIEEYTNPPKDVKYLNTAQFQIWLKDHPNSALEYEWITDGYSLGLEDRDHSKLSNQTTEFLKFTKSSHNQHIRSDIKYVFYLLYYIELALYYFHQNAFTHQDTHTSAQIARDLHKGRVKGTKLNYVSLLRNYFNYALIHGENPAKPYIDPIVAT